MEGRLIRKGILRIGTELTRFSVGPAMMSKGKYVFRAMDSKGRLFVLPFEKN
jgi:hypothetical protein